LAKGNNAEAVILKILRRCMAGSGQASFGLMNAKADIVLAFDLCQLLRIIDL